MQAEIGLKPYADRVDERLAQLLPASPADSSLPNPVRLIEAMRYAALAPGKRLRPAMCMASCEAGGGSAADAIDAGCAIECVHCFSLIHDDLPAIDDDDLRRGRPTVHRQFDEATAILAGDALFSLAFEIVAGLDQPPTTRIQAIHELCRASGVGGLVGGEALDIVSERLAPSAELVERIHALKTGSLIAASCAIGGLCSGLDDDGIERLRRYGHRVGVAFQIVDDILNETGDAESIGKATKTDEARGKQTVPRVIGLEAAAEEANRLVDLACAELETLPGPTSALVDLARFSVWRLH